MSLDQFYLPAGVRVAAVLLFPPRWWPYLLLGEYAYFAKMRVPMIENGLGLDSAGWHCTVMLVMHLPENDGDHEGYG